MADSKTTWLEYSKYVLITIDRLVNTVTRNEQEVNQFREDLVKALTKLKEEIRKENVDSHVGAKKDLARALDKIDALIHDLCNRTVFLEKQDSENIIDQKLSDFKDRHVTPVRLKVLVISAMLGMVGGLFAVVIPELLWRWFHG